MKPFLKKPRQKMSTYNERICQAMSDSQSAHWHSLIRPDPSEPLPVYIQDNPSKDYYFPVTKEDIEVFIQKLPPEDVEGVTHIWFRREAINVESSLGYLGDFIGDYNVSAIVLYPWPVDEMRLWSTGSVSLRNRKFFESFNAQLIQKKNCWYIFFEEEEDLKRFYLEGVFLFQLGFHVYSSRYWRYAKFEKHANFAKQYALSMSKKLDLIKDESS